MNEPVSSAIALCNAACTEESSNHAYNALLFAVGNNHAGTYDSSALALVEALAQMLSNAGPWSQRAALEAMIDLYASFEPEPGCSVYQGQQLAIVLRRHIAALEPGILAIARAPGTASSSAQELLELLHAAAA
jgi:hypothetical protein